MEVILYKVSDDERKINKALENGIALNLNIRRNVDVLNPVFLIRRADTFNPGDFNYLTWNNAYYFIRDIEYTAKGVYRLETHIDVLMTYKDYILNSKCHVTQSDDYDSYYDGGDWLTLAKPVSRVFNSNVTMPDIYTMVLVTIGGLE